MIEFQCLSDDQRLAHYLRIRLAFERGGSASDPVLRLLGLQFRDITALHSLSTRYLNLTAADCDPSLDTTTSELVTQCQSLPHHHGIPFIFYAITVPGSFPDYTIVHDSYLWALFSYVTDKKVFEANNRIESIDKRSLQSQLKPIVSPRDAQNVELQVLLPMIHAAHEAVYFQHFQNNIFPESGDVRDFNHSISDIMTAIDFATTTAIQPNQFCGIWPFLDPNLNQISKCKRNRNNRLGRSPLGRCLEVVSNKANPMDNFKSDRNPSHLSAYHANPSYGPIGLAFKVINAHGNDFAIDELTSILQGISVTQHDLSTNSSSEVFLLPPSPFLNSSEAAAPYSDIVLGYTPNIPEARYNGWCSNTTIACSPTSVQIELFLYAILRRVSASLLLVLFRLIPDRQLLVDVAHIVELEYGIDPKADPDWEEVVVQLPSEFNRWGRTTQTHFRSNIDEKPVPSTGLLDSKIIQTKLTLAFCLETAGTRLYAPDFVHSLEQELAPLGWEPLPLKQ